MLTQEEVRCMQDTFGEALLEQIKDLRITSQVASDPDSRFLFQCITPESINRVGLALIRADAPLSEETAACILEVLQESSSGSDPVAVSLLEAGSGALECLNNEEALVDFPPDELRAGPAVISARERHTADAVAHRACLRPGRGGRGSSRER